MPRSSCLSDSRPEEAEKLETIRLVEDSELSVPATLRELGVPRAADPAAGIAGTSTGEWRGEPTGIRGRDRFSDLGPNQRQFRLRPAIVSWAFVKTQTEPSTPSRVGLLYLEANGVNINIAAHLQGDVMVLSSSVGAWQTWPMKRDTLSYHGYRFPPDIISHAVWLYHRFGVSFRDVEDLLAQRGITVSYEAIRLWCLTFGSVYARRLKRRQGRLGDIWHLDEVFVTIQGQRRYLWRAVDQDGDVIDILVQSRRDCRAATRFFRKLLKGQERTPGRLVTDKLSSYRAAHRAVMPSVAHRTDRYENNRAEVSHQPTRQRERQMRRFKSPGQAQRFLSVHGLVRNLFRVGRHLVRAVHHRELRGRSFLIWDAVTIAA